ncbi:prohead core scaffold protein [Synechococcus phage DSL-LC02]|nr:prohead core scaffold protein [Synechococcus phage DSL-LC02]
MSRKTMSNLQEEGAPMYASTKAAKQSKTAVNANAQAGDGMVSNPFVGSTPGQSITDLGGPTPDNYRSTDDSAKLATGNIKTVRDVVNAKAARAEDFEYDEDEELLEASHEAEEEEEEEGEEEEKGKKKMKKESVEDEEEGEEGEEELPDEIEVDVEEDVQALFGGEDLSEEFKEKARTVLEAAVRTKVQEAADIIAAKYEAALQENVIAIQEELTERVDSYLEYVAEEWLVENALQVENGLKSQLAENFMAGLRGLFEENYVEMPEEKYDVLEQMVEKLDEMESKLNEQIERNVQLNQRLSESVSDSIFYEVARGLAETQKSKLSSLAESVEFVSEEDYREKLETLRESYFPRNPVSHTRDEEMLGTSVGTISESMDAYIRAVQKHSK